MVEKELLWGAIFETEIPKITFLVVSLSLSHCVYVCLLSAELKNKL